MTDIPEFEISCPICGESLDEDTRDTVGLTQCPMCLKWVYPEFEERG